MTGACRVLSIYKHVENCADIAAFYEKVKGRSFRYDNTALKPYYDELIEIIK